MDTTSSPEPVAARDIRFLAFYLPQFHPIPENDAWWGRGFTEWRNVVQARPLFSGHHQPRLPADLGFYDLRLPETRVAQAELARAHGIDGFCYYHYWFGGRRLLERPFDEVLASGVPDLPFCLCWANEPWSRTWSGRGSSFLIGQTYSHDDDVNHIRHLIDAFRDPRYICVDGRPLLLVYNLKAMPEPRRTIDTWASECEGAGVARPYVVKCDTFLDQRDPTSFGADAACEFPPHGAPDLTPARSVGGSSGYQLVDYEGLANATVRRPPPAWTRYPCVVPSWDNSPRRGDGGATVLDGAEPEAYQRWLVAAARRIASEVDEPLVFINAWNEWAEGAVLEPDQQWGRAYLEATLAARRTVSPGFEPRPSTHPPAQPADFAALSERLAERCRELESEAAHKYEAGQEAVRQALDERDTELAAVRVHLRRSLAWAQALGADLTRLDERLGATPSALEAEVARLTIENEALAARTEGLGLGPYRRARLWLGRRRTVRRGRELVRRLLD